MTLGINQLSPKQRQILEILIEGDGRDVAGNLIPCDLDELMTRLDYKPSKQSLQFSIRALIRRDFIYRGEHVNRRGRKRVLILPTTLARQVMSSKLVVGILEPEPEVIVSPVDLQL